MRNDKSPVERRVELVSVRCIFAQIRSKAKLNRLISHNGVRAWPLEWKRQWKNGDLSELIAKRRYPYEQVAKDGTLVEVLIRGHNLSWVPLWPSEMSVLKALLPRLVERGHRSRFVILFLDVLGLLCFLWSSYEVSHFYCRNFRFRTFLKQKAPLRRSYGQSPMSKTEKLLSRCKDCPYS